MADLGRLADQGTGSPDRAVLAESDRFVTHPANQRAEMLVTADADENALESVPSPAAA